MKKYSILIVGLKCYSGHIREFIVNLKKKNPQAAITLFTTDKTILSLDGMAKSADRIEVLKSTGVKLPVITTIINRLYLYKSLLSLLFSRRFDIVDIHFPKGFVIHAMPLLRRMTRNIVITPWGSDVMRVENEKDIRRLTRIYSQAKHVTVSKDSPTGKAIMSKFSVVPEKMVELKWGGEFFDYIQEHSSEITTEEAKARFGLEGRYVITCGYNTQQAQRHEDIMEAISGVKDQLPDNLTLLIPCTYVSYNSLSEQKRQYVESLEEKGKELGLHVKVVREHLELNDLLKLRMATDIFVHVQLSDAGARSVMEYVFCNKKLVHGAWNKYKYLEDYKPSCYFPIEEMEELDEAIVKASKAQVGELPQEVKKIILERGWNHKMTQWNEFFESLIS